MPGQIQTGDIHHLRLTVTDLQRRFGIDVLPFEDPDGIQLELTAPVAPFADSDQ